MLGSDRGAAWRHQPDDQYMS